VISESKGEKNMTAHQPDLGLPKQGTTFAQIFFEAFNGKSIRKKCTKIWCPAQKLWHKICSKITAEILAKQNSFFCAIYLMLVPLRKVQTGW
jgi:hypothetical protein